MDPLTRREFLAYSAAALAWLAGCAPMSQTIQTPAPTQGANVIPTPDHLDQMIGQMILVGFRGLIAKDDSPIVRDIRTGCVGGVVLFDFDVATASPVRNVQSPEQLKTLNAVLQRAATTPLLISIDQEGGKVARLKEKAGFPANVSAQHLGVQNDLATTRRYAETMAQALVNAGINLNLAPVVDVNTNPQNPIIAKYERSFSVEPGIVADHALEFIRAHHKLGVLTTLKHFPGHGSSREDSHLGLVDVTKTWARSELNPYAKIIQAGECDVVMTAHVFNANLDGHYPATLSKKIIGGILRDELGFDGVVMSDDMQMGAIAQKYGFENAVQLAIDAGVDILAFANNSLFFDENIATRAFTVVQRLVREGKVSRARIEQSYTRVMRLKARL
ncbi:MAG: glycoside hydrolase family 3 protein [Chloroflexi bacterium]|nr:glycoside hydrolase family 3 protein [Chloroflexota bacterium]